MSSIVVLRLCRCLLVFTIVSHTNQLSLIYLAICLVEMCFQTAWVRSWSRDRPDPVSVGYIPTANVPDPVGTLHASRFTEQTAFLSLIWELLWVELLTDTFWTRAGMTNHLSLSWERHKKKNYSVWKNTLLTELRLNPFSSVTSSLSGLPSALRGRRNR